MKMKHLAPIVAALLLSAPLAGVAHAQEEEVCAPNYGPTPLRLLRQYSLDLRGQVPSVDEYEQVRAAEDPAAVVEAMRAEMIASAEFRRTVREYHRRMLWTNFSVDVLNNVVNGSHRLVRNAARDIWFQPNQRRRYRKRNNVMCDDVPHTNFDDQGYPNPMRSFEDPSCDGGTCFVDGYVMVSPYWDPSTEIKVCAFDAQAHPTRRNGTTACGYTRVNAECGCGPNLQYCVPQPGQRGGVSERFRDALEQEPLRLIEDIVTGRRNYLDIFRANETRINGALAHYYRFLNESENELLTNRVNYYLGVEEMPAMSFADDSWQTVSREEAAGAGVLTSPAYLVRFTSNRGRASRFYEAFYCDPFVPSEDGIPPSGDDNPNLREVAGCADCHRTLEPAAAHWGRFRTGAEIGMFHDEAVFSLTEQNGSCAACGPESLGGNGNGCSAFCNAYHVTRENSHPTQVDAYLGRPLAMAWLEEGEDSDVAAGPANLVDEPSEQARVASCAVRTLAQNLLHRDMTVDDIHWLEEQTAAFESDWDWVGMVERMTADARYLETHE